MVANKIKPIEAAFLIKDTSIEIVYIKLQNVSAFQCMDFQRRLLWILPEEGYLFFEFLPDFYGKSVILGQKLRFYCDEIFAQPLLR